MKLNELKPKKGAITEKNRVGRGIGSGKGKTSGRGMKGQKARTGVAIKGFEGGQMPLDRRLPKFGFTNIFRKNYAELNLDKLQAAIDAKKFDASKPVDEGVLLAAGVVSNKKDGIKLLGYGNLRSKIDIKVSKASASARAAVEKAGGRIILITDEEKK
jgi:large subunit ribosomal protein L15